MPAAWFVMKDYQRERIMVFLDPVRDPLGSAYNVIQAKIAIGSGQLLGKGVAGATQSRLSFLPERHTDFIFAVFAEMWGFVGCILLLACYAVLLSRGFDIAASAREPVGRLVALGATALLATQILINVGMVTGLLPVVGVPLPLMSYGGSSMLTTLMRSDSCSRYECGSSNETRGPSDDADDGPASARCCRGQTDRRQRGIHRNPDRGPGG